MLDSADGTSLMLGGLAPADDGTYWTHSGGGRSEWVHRQHDGLRSTTRAYHDVIIVERAVSQAKLAQTQSSCHETAGLAGQHDWFEPSSSSCDQVTSGGDPSFPIFVHAPPKSATTTLGRFLSTLGYRRRGYAGVHFERRFTGPIRAMNSLVDGASWGNLPNQSTLLSAHPDAPNLLAHSRHFGAFSDSPFGHVFGGEGPGLDLRAKLVLWPRARFVWSDRPVSDAALSWCHWKVSHGSANASDCAEPNVAPAGLMARTLAEIAKARALVMLLRESHPERVHVIRWADGQPCHASAQRLVAFLMGERCGRRAVERGVVLQDLRARRNISTPVRTPERSAKPPSA